MLLFLKKWKYNKQTIKKQTNKQRNKQQQNKQKHQQHIIAPVYITGGDAIRQLLWMIPHR